MQPKEFVDWSLQSYEYDVSSKEDGLEDSVTRWIIGKKRKRLPQEEPDQHIVQDLIINIKQQIAQQSMGHHHSMKTVIEEASKNIVIPILFG